ncbi:hypothetical protein [Deinococcus peraridilitoris]|uniref:hypothetical protein n=1 Tax=Deinococcus peraridilitoris TaxID=432329 RepID=UPI0012FB95B5|nr:hypothetical protein [Deinococcus peraridilitoris]
MLYATAWKFLQRQLGLPGRTRGGLIFGHHFQDTLHVLLAGTSGLPWWYKHDEERGVLDIDARFTLGWSEAVGEVLQGHADWCGNWLIHSDEQLAEAERDAAWFRRGLKLGLFDDRHILMVVGFEEGLFWVRAYLLGAPNEPFEVEVVFEEGGVERTLRQIADLISTKEE